MSSSVKLFIKPNDVLFFRDGRPFDAGSDNTARMVFPPSPTTFYGALRTAIMSQKNVDFAELKNSKNLDSTLSEIAINANERTLSISDFGLVRKKGNNFERLFPVPFDIVKEKDKEKFFILSPMQNDKVKMNFPNNNLIPLGLKTQNDEIEPIFESCNDYFLTEPGLKTYLENEQLDIKHFVKRTDVFLIDHRVGIRRDNATFSSQEGFLYSLEFACLNKKYNDIKNIESGFIVEVNSQLLKSDNNYLKLLRLGGESRTAFYEVIENLNEIPKPKDITNRFKLILITPAIFKRGWLPDGINEEVENGKKILKGKLDGLEVKLVSTSVDRYVGIGGWDILEGRSKPLKRAVPAGSVYFFERINGKNFNVNELINRIFMKSIMKDENLRKEGLGLIIIGAW